MGKKRNSQAKFSQVEQRRRWKWQLILPAAAVLLAAIIGIVPSLREWFKSPSLLPAFALANPITRPDSGIVVIAQNQAAQREEPLNVEFDGYLFANAAQRQPLISPYTWRFALDGLNLPDSLFADGPHRVRVGFAGEVLSDYFMIGFTTQPPIVTLEVTQPRGKPYDRIFSGKVASKLQAPAETMSVDIAFHSEGRPVEISVPVKRIEVNGITYFEIETEVQGLPRISPDDPRYSKPFFAIRVTDQAGNRYYQEESYAQFMAPGDKRFGINSLNNIKVQRLPVDLRANTKVAFRVMPKALPRTLLDSGQQALILNVKSLAANIKQLNWLSNLPEDLRNAPRLTLIYRDQQYLAISFNNEYKDEYAPEIGTTRYHVEQTSKNGITYMSNEAQMPLDNTNKKVEPLVVSSNELNTAATNAKRTTRDSTTYLSNEAQILLDSVNKKLPTHTKESDELNIATNGTVRTGEALAAVVRKHNEMIQYCYQREVKQNSSLKGQIRVRIVINPRGSVDSVAVISSTFENLAIEECIVGRIKRWNDFGQSNPTKGSVAIKQTYVFGY